MTTGIDIRLRDGFAELEFTDPALKGPTLHRLHEVIDDAFIDVDTGGTRRTYIVPESAARDAGLLDGVEIAKDGDDAGLTRAQKAAATRKANKERAEREAQAAANADKATIEPEVVVDPGDVVTETPTDSK